MSFLLNCKNKINTNPMLEIFAVVKRFCILEVATRHIAMTKINFKMFMLMCPDNTNMMDLQNALL